MKTTKTFKTNKDASYKIRKVVVYVTGDGFTILKAKDAGVQVTFLGKSGKVVYPSYKRI